MAKGNMAKPFADFYSWASSLHFYQHNVKMRRNKALETELCRRVTGKHLATRFVAFDGIIEL